MSVVVAFLFSIATLCSGQAPASASAAPMTTYHSEAMSLDFLYPSSFKSDDDAASAKDADRRGESNKSCTTLPLAAMDMKQSFNMIFLRRFDGACLGKEITAAERSNATVGFLNNLLTQFGKPAMNSSTDYDLASHMASAVSGSVKPKGVKPAGTVIYGAVSCVATGKDLACFAFLSSDC